MSGRHGSAEARSARTARRLAGASASATAAVFALAPLAHADAKPRPATDSAAPSGTDQSGTSARTAKAAPVQPDYGTQKIRVGVQEKSDDFYRAGTTTVGTNISITETGPNAENNTRLFGTSCTTVAGPDSPEKSYCDFSSKVPVLRRDAALQRRAGAAGVDVRTLLAAGGPVNYLVAPGDTVVFKQTSVKPNMQIDTSTLSFGPCLNPVPNVRIRQAVPDLPTCDSKNAVDEVFTDPGLPPTANHDSGVVKPGGSITVHVLGNDTTADAPPTIKIIDPPSHGTAKVVNQSAPAVRALRSAAAPAIRYTPDAGFFGHDSLRYSLTTANGTKTATVSLRVAAPPTATDDSASTSAGTAVTVDVLANDHRNGGGALSIDSVGDAGHGTVKIKDGTAVYTPDEGFAGTDTFTYVARNSLGTDTATVTVTVSGVANTGTPSGELVGIAALLIVSGAAATAAGRRRYRARHAGGA